MHYNSSEGLQATAPLFYTRNGSARMILQVRARLFWSVVSMLSLLFCLGPLHRAAAQDPKPQLTCSIDAIDSVFFDKIDYNKYLPSTFTIRVLVTNASALTADNVKASVVNNPRFTTETSVPVLVTQTMPGGDTVSVFFSLTVKPRQVSGNDTIIVSVTANGGVSTDCFEVIWVEKEYKPKLVLVCPTDRFVIPQFDDNLNDYIPNPVSIPLKVRNLGDAPSKETRMLYNATPGISAFDNPVIDIGMLQPGEEQSYNFRVKLNPRFNDTIVEPRFNLQGRGGLGDPLQDTACSFELPIPSIREVHFELTCDNDIEIQFIDDKYEPNPFVWKTTVKNAGTAVAYSVSAQLELPPVYESTESATKLLGTMNPGEEREVSWTIRIKPVQFADTSAICVTVYDIFSRSATCCDTLILPAEQVPEMAAECNIVPDTIFADPQTGMYKPDRFTAFCTVRNTGTQATDSVTVEILLTDSNLALDDPAQTRKLAAAQLVPNASQTVQWDVLPLQTSTARTASIQFVVKAKNIPGAISTDCQIYIQASILPELVCYVETSPVDTIHYDYTTLRYEELTLTASVTNTGANASDSVYATVSPSTRITLPGGEVPRYGLPAEFMKRDSSWTIRWRLKPIEQREGSLETLRVEFRTGKIKTVCTKEVFVVGIPPVTALIIPGNEVAQYGRSFTLPIRIDDASGKDIHRMNVFVEYDDSKLEFLGFDRVNTLLQRWNFADLSVPGVIGFSADNLDSSLTGTGILTNMDFKVVFGSGQDKLNWAGVELAFDSIQSRINEGTILARYYNGYVYVSGDCLFPLDATEDYVVLQSKPNPFNPSTDIIYHLPSDGYVSLKVYTVFGAEIAAPVGEYQSRGMHSVHFDAQSLPAGTYICVLQAGGMVVTHKLLLMK